MPNTYTLVIDEEQRQLLVVALRKHCGPMKLQPNEELVTLLELFTELPSEELFEPGIVHGFCY